MVVFISLLTEYFDGALSRWLKIESKMGALLDPIADKFFIFSVLLTIFFESELRWYQLALFTTRAIVVLMGSLFLIYENNWKAFMHITPSWWGKLTTTFQFIFLMSYIYWQKIFPIALYPAIILSVIAGADYFSKLLKNNFYRHYLENENDPI